MGPAERTTVSIRASAKRLAVQRAAIKSISLGDAISELILEGEANRPQTRLEIRDGWPVLIPPPGTPKLTMEMVKQAMDEDG